MWDESIAHVLVSSPSSAAVRGFDSVHIPHWWVWVGLDGSLLSPQVINVRAKIKMRGNNAK